MKEIIQNCSPTLAGIKCAGLVSLKLTRGDIDRINRAFSGKGLFAETVRESCGRSVVLIYRPSQLEKLLEQSGIKAFLSKCGYEDFSLSGVLKRLKERMREQDFPHEVGLILGYPLEDVEGFIKNGGKDFLLCGYWKVYSDAKAKKAIFDKYRLCTDIYTKLYALGIGLSQLAVAA